MKSLLLTLLLLLAFEHTALGSTQAINEHTNLALLLNVAGKQRMLSQSIAKDYFYQAQGIRPERTRREMLASLKAFSDNLNLLKREVKDEKVQEMLRFLEVSLTDYWTLAKAPFSQDNGWLILDYSEVLLEGSQSVVDALEAMASNHKETVIDLSGRQRMLAQRIAKFYIAFQAGFRDASNAKALHQAVQEFEVAQQQLLSDPNNTPEIVAELKRVERLWRTVKRFYEDVEHGGLPTIVLVTTENIMTSMDRVTRLYVSALSGGAVPDLTIRDVALKSH